jgi:hypothetical protein
MNCTILIEFVAFPVERVFNPDRKETDWEAEAETRSNRVAAFVALGGILLVSVTSGIYSLPQFNLLLASSAAILGAQVRVSAPPVALGSSTPASSNVGHVVLAAFCLIGLVFVALLGPGF